MATEKIQEEELGAFDGWIILLCILFIGVLTIFFTNNFFIYGLVGFLLFFMLGGFFILNPNQAVVGTFFGKYSGSQKNAGFYWVNPFIKKNVISTKVQNLSTQQLKVNDKSGNPIEVAAVFVWQVDDTARAMFSVENHEEFLKNQCESALRKVVSNFNYDSEDGENLKSNTEGISKLLKEGLSKLTSFAGLEILDARLTHLAYAPEIAQAMLKKQQAQAVVAARTKIVEGAVNMVQEVLTEMEDRELAEFTNEDKIHLITNLMTVLVSDNETTPTIQLNEKNHKK